MQLRMKDDYLAHSLKKRLQEEEVEIQNEGRQTSNCGARHYFPEIWDPPGTFPFFERRQKKR